MKPDEEVALLVEKWKNGFLPVISGVGWPSGEIAWVNLLFRRDTERHLLAREEEFRVRLADIMEEGNLHWSAAGPACEAKNEQQRLRAIGGEGNLGADGFVAVSAAGSGELVWYAFFEASNPFEQIRFEGDVLVATNNLGDEFRFPLDSPASFSIHHTRPFG